MSEYSPAELAKLKQAMADAAERKRARDEERATGRKDDLAAIAKAVVDEFAKRFPWITRLPSP